MLSIHPPATRKFKVDGAPRQLSVPAALDGAERQATKQCLETIARLSVRKMGEIGRQTTIELCKKIQLGLGHVSVTIRLRESDPTGDTR
jgi:hypothetical protein